MYGNHLTDNDLLNITTHRQGHCTSEEEAVTWEEGWHNLERIRSNQSNANTSTDNDGNVLVMNIGVSNFDIRLLEALVDRTQTKISVIQNWCDPFHQDRNVRAFAKKHGIVYMAYSSFGTRYRYERTLEGYFCTINTMLRGAYFRSKKALSPIVL